MQSTALNQSVYFIDRGPIWLIKNYNSKKITDHVIFYFLFFLCTESVTLQMI